MANPNWPGVPESVAGSDWNRWPDTPECADVAENVVFLATLNHFTTRARLSDIGAEKFGIREILLLPTPQKDWPQSGFQVAVVHLKRGWSGACKIDDRYLAGHTYPVKTR